MSSVMGFRSDTMPRPAKEMDMMRMRESLQEDDAQTEARPQADRRQEKVYDVDSVAKKKKSGRKHRIRIKNAHRER